MSHFDDKIHLQLENVFQLVQNERGSHVTIDQHMFASVPDECNLEFRVIL